MKRDDDLLRAMLFEFEAQDDWLIIVPNTLNMSKEDRVRVGHVNILADAGFVTPVKSSIYRLTNAGYDYLDAIRDDNVWKKTKAASAKVGGVGLGIMKDLAVGILKQELSKHTGIQL